MSRLEQEGVYRAAVLNAARKVMDEAKIGAWLESPHADLAGQRPSALIDDPMGVQMVIRVLQRKAA